MDKTPQTHFLVNLFDHFTMDLQTNSPAKIPSSCGFGSLHPSLPTKLSPPNGMPGGRAGKPGGIPGLNKVINGKTMDQMATCSWGKIMYKSNSYNRWKDQITHNLHTSICDIGWLNLIQPYLNGYNMSHPSSWLGFPTEHHQGLQEPLAASEWLQGLKSVWVAAF